MRISDWSSDVCSSDVALNDIIPQVTQLQIGCDLLALRPPNKRSSPGFRRHFDYRLVEQERTGPLSHASLIVRVTKLGVGGVKDNQIGRARGRERVWQYVSLSVVAGAVKKKTT